MRNKPESNEDFVARIKAAADADRAAMDSAILDVVRQFASLENGMASVLEELLHGSWIYAAPLIYFASSNTETRAGIVDAVFRNARLPSDAVDLSTQWNAFMNRFGRVKASRNKIIHGQVAHFGNVNAHGTHVRLTPAFGDALRTDVERRKGYPFGLTAHDVQNVANTVSRLSLDAKDFAAILHAIRTDDAPTWRERLAQLVARHPKVGAQSDGQIPPAPDAQPRPSEG